MYLPWTEKYRPCKSKDVVSQSTTIKIIDNFIKNKNMPHLLLSGMSGTGKTSTINVMAHEFYKDDYNLMVLEINASEERGIGIIRDKVVHFISATSILGSKYPYKMVILDEIDEMTFDAQIILKKVIDKYKYVRFCLICNYIKKVILQIRSRCCCFQFSFISNENIKARLYEIIDKEKISITDKGIDIIASKSGGDLRKAINTLQSLHMSYDKILSESIYNVIGCLHYKDIDIIFNKIINESFQNSFNYINNKMIGHSYSDLISELYKKILKTDLKDKLKIIKRLGELEQSSDTTIIMLSGIIGCFNV